MIDPLRGEAYLNLETFKRNGDGVKTPVWFVHMDDGRLGIFTDGTSYKVKRLRRDKRVRVAPCGVAGGLKGKWEEGSCEILSDTPDIQAIEKLLRKKYGIQMSLLNISSTIFRRKNRRAFLAVTRRPWAQAETPPASSS